jgi:hypothetical protein
MATMTTIRKKLIAAIRHTVLWGECRVPRGLRSVVGILLMMGGVVGFLPILGFWMIPAGLALIALDVPTLRRRLLQWALRDQTADDVSQPAQNASARKIDHANR